MNRSHFQRTVSLICLLACTLGQAVIGSFAVRCTDAAGHSRVELACIRDSAGQCAARCDDVSFDEDKYADHTEPAAPCEDERIAETTIARTQSNGASFDPVVSQTLVAFGIAPSWALSEAIPSFARGFEVRHGRPPDALARLRTVILLV